MKKLLTAIICAAMIAVNFAGVEPARASQTSYTYAQAVTETAYFFTQKDVSTSLFAVPYTYCVRVVRDDGQWYYVQYAEDEGIYRAVYGYVLKSDFTLLDSEPPATYLFKSITVDNGCEFQDFEGIEAAHRRKGKRTIVFFCHPYSAFERGSNENMNRLIRRFFPKGTSFDTVKPEEVRAAERWVNNYPRKLLGWKSAAMLFEKELLSA